MTTSCNRCGLNTRCTVERCRRCAMVRVAVCQPCDRETGGQAADWQRREHDERRCRHVPAVRAGMEE